MISPRTDADSSSNVLTSSIGGPPCLIAARKRGHHTPIAQPYQARAEGSRGEELGKTGVLASEGDKAAAIGSARRQAEACPSGWVRPHPDLRSPLSRSRERGRGRGPLHLAVFALYGALFGGGFALAFGRRRFGAAFGLLAVDGGARTLQRLR